MRAGFALQLVTVRWLGTFLEDPLDVPGGVLDFVAGQQLGMADPSKVKRYTEGSTRGSITSGRSGRTAATGSSATPRRGSRRGRRPGRGRPGTGPKRASPAGRSRARGAEVSGVGLARFGAEGGVPPRRMAEVSRYGMTASASLIRRHSDPRQLATLVATVRHLEGRSIDDALELLDLLMTTELLGRAQRESDKENARRQPRLARASPRLARAVEARV